MIAALAPTRILVEGAQLLWNPPLVAVTLVPHGAARLEQPAIHHQHVAGTRRVDGRGPLPDEGDEGRDGGRQALVAAHEGRAVGNGREAKLLGISGMGVGGQPALLGLELGNAAQQHAREKDDQQALRIGQRPSTVAGRRLRLFKAVEERRIVADIGSADGRLHSTPPEGCGEHSVW
jgi:hypothetical protein